MSSQTMDTISVPVSQKPLKRIAIVGTAPTWRQCPFDDKTLHIASLNDAYMLGLPRADVWFDLHPLHQMVFRPRDQKVDPRDVPAGGYLRPAGHLEWLKAQAVPVFLNQARPDWPNAKAFPRAALEAQFANAWPLRRNAKGVVSQGPPVQASTPDWMLMWAIAEGYTEIHIYGIHLATEWEYVRQRPNLEYLIGYARGMGLQIVLPAEAPICKGAHVYAYDVKPDIRQDAIKREMTALKLELKRLAKQAPGWFGSSTNARVQQVQIELQDAQHRLDRESVTAQFGH